MRGVSKAIRVRVCKEQEEVLQELQERQVLQELSVEVVLTCGLARARACAQEVKFFGNDLSAL